jgi:hypothetical protein
VQLRFPQTRSRETAKYPATECKIGEFRYCLELAGASRGVKKYTASAAGRSARSTLRRRFSGSWPWAAQFGGFNDEAIPNGRS